MTAERGKRASPGPASPISDSWLAHQRAELPDPIAGYVSRPELEGRCTAMDRGLTLLDAPGGFGKTALLAECCRRLRDGGTRVAWLTLNEEDGPDVLAAYLALALEKAGFPRTPAADRVASGARIPATYTRAGYRIHLLLRSIERLRAPCLLALDELERVTDPEVVAALNTLLGARPRNLRLAMALRRRPIGLDIALLTLEGRAEVVTANDLRFSTAEITRFFDAKLSPDELEHVAARSAGWPIALRILGNAAAAGTPVAEVAMDTDTIGAWIESRLWRGLAAEDRDFILDIALFDWIEAELVEEATGVANVRLRLESTAAIAAMLQTAGGRGGALRLHPLFRDYCAKRRFTEDPGRYRAIHRVIAGTLARRGLVVEALRHAAETGDSRLVADIALQAGGIQLWIRRGFGALRAVDAHLSADVLSRYPRLALVRALVLAVSGDVDSANRVYAATDTAGSDSESAEDTALLIDRILVSGLLQLMGCGPAGWYDSVVDRAISIIGTPGLDPTARGMLKLGVCIAFNETARFDLALEWADRARADFGRTTLYLSPHADYQAGVACMAQGRSSEAAALYERGLADAREHRLGDTSTVLFGEILLAELALECSAAAPRLRPPPVAPSVLAECGAWIDIYAASASVSAEFALADGGVDAALTVLADAREFARCTMRPGFATLLSALRVSLLLAAGRTGEAERFARSDGLPECNAACLDLASLRWREVEALAVARIDLLAARGEFEDARELAAGLLDMAVERRLLRTAMRGLACALRLEVRAGDSGRATAHLERYVEFFKTTGYARPLACERQAALPLLEILALGRWPLAATAARLHKALTDSPQGRRRP